ncbi:MAG: ABC transporter substrate-binding protein [Lautropia sp.]
MTAVQDTSLDVLWYTRCPVPTATSIAIETGLLDRHFEPDGIAVRSLNASDSRATRESHFDHGTRGLFRHGGNTPPIWARSRGVDTAVIALSWVDEYQAILALPESGIRTIKDLRGRRLGVPVRVNDRIDFFRAMSMRGYLTALDLGGIARSDVEFVELPITERYIGAEQGDRRGTLWSGAQRSRRQQAEMFALIRGDIDAFVTSGGMGAYLAAMLGAHEVLEFGSHPDSDVRISNQAPATLTVDRWLLEHAPQLAVRFLKQVMLGADWAVDHPAQARRIVGRETGVLEDWVERAYGARFHTRMALSLDDRSIRALVKQKDFLLENGFIAADFDVAEWIRPEALAQAARER